MSLKSSRLVLKPLSWPDFDVFVRTMLTDPVVVEYFYQYVGLDDLEEIHNLGKKDFWDHFEESRKNTGLEVWSIFDGEDRFIGWSGLLETELTPRYNGPELQYMLASAAHGKGYATEAAALVLDDASERASTDRVIATVDIPNKPSIRILEKLGFTHDGQIEAYGSTEMYLYSLNLIS
jgi:RimJ/RimL family protein N-acetyltransferase